MALRRSAQGFLIVAAFALAAFFAGCFLGIIRTACFDYSGWNELASTLGDVDVPRFVRVTYPVGIPLHP